MAIAQYFTDDGRIFSDCGQRNRKQKITVPYINAKLNGKSNFFFFFFRILFVIISIVRKCFCVKETVRSRLMFRRTNDFVPQLLVLFLLFCLSLFFIKYWTVPGPSSCFGRSRSLANTGFYNIYTHRTKISICKPIIK